jgi:hypothetical protein
VAQRGRLDFHYELVFPRLWDRYVVDDHLVVFLMQGGQLFL